MAGKKKTILIQILCGMLVVFLTAAITWQVAVRSFSGDKYLLTKEQFDRFSQYQKIDEIIANIGKNHYADVSENDLITGAYKGVAQSADRYSDYFTQEDMELFSRSTSGKGFGIGVLYSINAQERYPQVKEVLENAPAAKAGLQVDDLIIEIDGSNIQNLNTDRISEMISGDKGTKVALKVRRGSEEKSIEVERAEFEQVVVRSKVIQGNIGYVRLSHFVQGCADKVEKAFKELQSKGCSRFILDLRGNTGGVLGEAVKIADLLLPEGRIVYTKTKAGVEEVYDSKAGSLGKPLIVLVNGQSASASEVLAGALQQAKVAKLVGTTTFGKGVVQNVYPLTDGKSWLKLTNSVYYLANGETPNEKGITPEQVVNMELQNTFDEDKDTQLKKAIELSK